MSSDQTIQPLYRSSLALLTDLYELTMAYGYWKKGMAEERAVFHLFFRKAPFKGSFALAAGLKVAAEYLEELHFTSSDLEYLEGLKASDGSPLFEKAFLDFLGKLRFECDVDAVPEGTPVFAYEPLLRVTGPILQAQILESALLNIINFQTLIATKAARICHAASPDPVIEFGLRRAQGIDGSLSASRAAFIGGCFASSSVLAGKFYGIPVKGTMAHSWVMAFDSELEAFEAYAEALASNCVFLVDTYDSLQGVKRAIKIGKILKQKGHAMLGIRLDSGDIAELSKRARILLDEAGFTDAKIMASNELDEENIQALKQQGAKVNLWGVGTSLVTAKDQPALDGVYKLSAIQQGDGSWKDRIKLSEERSKGTCPGILQVRRYFDGQKNICDMIYDSAKELVVPLSIASLQDSSRIQEINPSWAFEDLLVPIMLKGRNVYTHPSLEKMQTYAQKELAKFDLVIRHLRPSGFYPVGLERSLHEKKLQMIQNIRGQDSL